MLSRCCLLLLWVCVQGYSTGKLPRGTSATALECPQDTNCHPVVDVTPNYNSLVAVGVSDFLFPREDDLQWWCDGALLGRQFVLTSASCIFSFTTNATKPYIIARLGSGSSANGSQQIPVSHLSIHPGYWHPAPQHQDLGLLRLARPADLTGEAAPVAACVSPPGGAPTAVSAVASARDHSPSHGKLKSEEAQWMSVDTVGCGKASDSSLLCVHSPDLLVKAAGPLMRRSACRTEVLGIPSYDAGAGAGGLLPYTRVSAFLQWLETTVHGYLAMDTSTN